MSNIVYRVTGPELMRNRLVADLEILGIPFIHTQPIHDAVSLQLMHILPDWDTFRTRVKRQVKRRFKRLLQTKCRAHVFVVVIGYDEGTACTPISRWMVIQQDPLDVWRQYNRHVIQTIAQHQETLQELAAMGDPHEFEILLQCKYHIRGGFGCETSSYDHLREILSRMESAIRSEQTTVYKDYDEILCCLRQVHETST